ncbi:MAG: phage terminase large subunit [Phycisphaerae bacterium]
MNPTTAQPLTHDAEIPTPQERPIGDPLLHQSTAPGGPAAPPPDVLAACACTARPPSPAENRTLKTENCGAAAPPFRPLGAARDLFNSRRQEILLAGPAGTGKTRAALEKLFLCLLKYPAMRALLVRKTRASLTQSVLVTLEEKVIPPNHPILLGPSRSHRHSYILPNKSELVIGGMDNANRIMSTEYDMILACEATELNLSDWEKLLTRLRNAKMPYQQAIAECNPSYPEHWLNMRANNGLMLRLISRHEDNPIYCDPKTGQWTSEGTRYIATLGRLSGVRRRRLLEGTWAAPEGRVRAMNPVFHW